MGLRPAEWPRRKARVMTVGNRFAYSNKRWRLLAGSTLVVLATAYLIWSGMQGGAVYALTIRELRTRAPGIYGQSVRVGGSVDGQSITWDATEHLLTFNLLDENMTLPVSYQGARPDMFRDGAQALVEGKWQRDGVFEASKLLLKCPSKYEAAATETAIH